MNELISIVALAVIIGLFVKANGWMERIGLLAVLIAVVIAFTLFKQG
jgi:hypothetical protein